MDDQRSTAPRPSADDAAGSAQHAADELTRRPRIYVVPANGSATASPPGVWIDATRDPDDIRASITGMLAAAGEPGEAYSVRDAVGFGTFRIGEYDTIETIHVLADGITEHGDAFTAYVRLVGTKAARTGFSDCYHGTYRSLHEFAESFAAEMGWISALDRLRNKTGIGRFLQIDYDALESTIRTEWDIVEENGTVHVFAI
ncbi:antirestriction protein ArdA [Mycolicibacterium sp.]|uniref:antirestriction protein ArdA n=1 Tax=Mycolicibacterium sp. TaxID=2320850 RepID=UPI0037C99DF6